MTGSPPNPLPSAKRCPRCGRPLDDCAPGRCPKCDRPLDAVDAPPSETDDDGTRNLNKTPAGKRSRPPIFYLLVFAIYAALIWLLLATLLRLRLF